MKKYSLNNSLYKLNLINNLKEIILPLVMHLEESELITEANKH
jgi:hypothetical protein